MKHSKGFTLIEILLVLMVIGMIISIMQSNMNYAGIFRQDYVNDYLSDVTDMEISVSNYLSDKEKYPEGEVDNDLDGAQERELKNFLTDTTFVPDYLFPPKSPGNFDQDFGRDGYFVTQAASGAIFVCARVKEVAEGDLSYKAIVELADKLPDYRFTASSTKCPHRWDSSYPGLDNLASFLGGDMYLSYYFVYKDSN